MNNLIAILSYTNWYTTEISQVVKIQFVYTLILTLSPQQMQRLECLLDPTDF